MLHQYCPECRTANDTGAKFCPKCGASNVVTPKSGPDEVKQSATAISPSNAPAHSRVAYDPGIIGVFAEDLYRRANLIVFVWTLIGAVCGAALLSLVLDDFGKFLGLLTGGAAGYFFGQFRAFMLRLQAQLALCAVQIEINTRH